MALSHSDREKLIRLLNEDPVSWIERNFYVHDPMDPTTGELLPPGPIILHPLQKRILRAALTKVDGTFPYVTVVYSTIKKSGKTRIGAAVASWFAATQGMYNEVYCLANDGKQSADRILSAVKESVTLNPHIDWHVTKTRVELPNHTFIEAIPCDPSGQAGSNPGLTVWSEMWGYKHAAKEKLWTEMTVPPVKFGRAMRWVESYAGYLDESKVLYNLYEQGREHGIRHGAFPDLPVYTNDSAKMLCYWDEGDAARRMPWQTEEYYAEEAATLVPDEFERIHRNKWIMSVNKAIPIEWWDACLGTVPPLDGRTPVIISADASVSHDCCALALVSRDPNNKGDGAMVRDIRIWTPPRGGKMDYTTTMEPTIREWVDKYNVLELVYDEYQLHDMMTRIRKTGKTWVNAFSQGSSRNVADKKLFDMIVTKRIVHDGNAVLRAHVDNAAAKTTGDKYRFVKMSDTKDKFGRTGKPIDALVALSMGTYECLRLNLE